MGTLRRRHSWGPTSRIGPVPSTSTSPPRGRGSRPSRQRGGRSSSLSSQTRPARSAGSLSFVSPRTLGGSRCVRALFRIPVPCAGTLRSSKPPSIPPLSHRAHTHTSTCSLHTQSICGPLIISFHAMLPWSTDTRWLGWGTHRLGRSLCLLGWTQLRGTERVNPLYRSSVVDDPALDFLSTEPDLGGDAECGG